MTKRGEFTRKFDRDILGDETAAAAEETARELALVKEDEAVDAEFNKILSVLEYRATWLTERFEGCSEATSVDFRGRRFEFKDKGKIVGWIEFRTHLTDSKMGITIESFMQLEGHFPKRHDYVTFPKENVKLDRAKKFIENKLMEFAGPYQDAHGS
jgi:hypothetical protein